MRWYVGKVRAPSVPHYNDLFMKLDIVYGWTGHRYPPNVSAGAEFTFDHTTI